MPQGKAIPTENGLSTLCPNTSWSFLFIYRYLWPENISDSQFTHLHCKGIFLNPSLISHLNFLSFIPIPDTLPVDWALWSHWKLSPARSIEWNVYGNWNWMCFLHSHSTGLHSPTSGFSGWDIRLDLSPSRSPLNSQTHRHMLTGNEQHQRNYLNLS